ncbi:tetratricopeptide repeat protein [Ancylobacter sp. MQZ15Z-1]|uniref:Tetratricopeptide repeat protein n=1 Tax=Ancylobacter mangrovi TaxID=2972472 RepID=A0A9X2PBY7_9HYPH|nr:tetratricopeptide repeat protein [Ancylobacter mangrovi]MCS0494086.1 tetratricopeptide repeat protein [Ancylobacter mangrovi]
MAALKSGDAAGARVLFEELVKRRPGEASAYVGLGRAYFMEKDYASALEHFQAALDIDPKQKIALLFSAECRAKLGDTVGAMEEYEEVGEIAPSLALGQMRLSRLHKDRSEFDEAEQRLKESLAFNPQQVPVRVMLADLYEKQGRSEEAREELERLLDIKPDSSIALYKLGRQALREKKYDLARQLLEEASELSPDNSVITYALGGALMALGRFAAAISAFKLALEHNPKLMMASLQIADCHVALGQHQEALAVLGELTRKHRRVGMVHKRIADIYTVLGRYGYAVEEYRAAVFNLPDLLEKNVEIAALMESADGDEELARKFQACFIGIKDEMQTNPEARPNIREGRPSRGRRALFARRGQ